MMYACEVFTVNTEAGDLTVGASGLFYETLSEDYNFIYAPVHVYEVEAIYDRLIIK
jgi:hypothetical protein